MKVVTAQQQHQQTLFTIPTNKNIFLKGDIFFNVVQVCQVSATKVRRKEKGWEKEQLNVDPTPAGRIVKQRLVKLIPSCYGWEVLAPALQLWILKDHSSQLSTLHTKTTHAVFGSSLRKELFLREALGEGSWLDRQWYIWIFGRLSIADMCLSPQRFLLNSPLPHQPANLLLISLHSPILWIEVKKEPPTLRATFTFSFVWD